MRAGPQPTMMSSRAINPRVKCKENHPSITDKIIDDYVACFKDVYQKGIVVHVNTKIHKADQHYNSWSDARLLFDLLSCVLVSYPVLIFIVHSGDLGPPPSEYRLLFKFVQEG